MRAIYLPAMQKLPGVLLFLLLVVIILEILTLRTLSKDEKRIYVLEQKLGVQPLVPTAAPAAPTSQPAEMK
jgi:hypothetical protein